MVEETPPLEAEDGLAAQPGGWYIVNARHVRWVGQDGMCRGAWLEPEDEPWTSLAAGDPPPYAFRYRDGDLPV